jgi:hypothetical protein
VLGLAHHRDHVRGHIRWFGILRARSSAKGTLRDTRRNVRAQGLQIELNTLRRVLVAQGIKLISGLLGHFSHLFTKAVGEHHRRMVLLELI